MNLASNYMTLSSFFLSFLETMTTILNFASILHLWVYVCCVRIYCQYTHMWS